MNGRDPGTAAHRDEDGTTQNINENESREKKAALTIESNGVRIMGHAQIAPSRHDEIRNFVWVQACARALLAFAYIVMS